MAGFWENDPIVSQPGNGAVNPAILPPIPLPPFGMKAPGNIDVSKRPVVRNPDGSISTVRSMSIGVPEGEVLIPTISPDGRQLSDDEAVKLYQQSGQNLGMFKSPDAATMFARNLHEGQADLYGAKTQPLPNSMPIGSTMPTQAAAGQWWANDPVVETEPTELSPQERYDAALEKVRQLEFGDMSPEEFRKRGVDPQATLIPGVTMPGRFAPYGPTELSQHGMFFGLTDEASAGMGALGAGIGQLFNGGKGPSMGDVYAAREELEAARRDLGREQMGGWGTLAEVAGGLGTGGMAAQGAAAIGAQAPRMFQTAKGLAGATASGGAYGFGATDGGLDQRLPGAALGAGTGFAAGVAAPIVARGVQKALAIPANRAAKSATAAAINSAPTAAAIKAASKASYKAAERTGAVVDGPAINLLSHDVRQMLSTEGMLLPNGQLVGGFPKVAGALKALGQFGANGSMTVKQAMTLNRTFRRVAQSTDPAEAEIGRGMVKQLDDFFENLPVQAFANGTGKAGMDAVKQWAAARTDWARFKKTDTIEKAIYNAGLDRQGFAAGLQDEFSKLLKSDKQRGRFTDAELAAMEKFVKGGSVQGFLQDLASGGSIPASILGLMTGGPVGAFAAGVGKATAGKLAGGALNSGAARAADVVRASSALPNGLPPLPLRSPPTIDGTFRTVAVNAANPGLDNQRKGLAALLQGHGVAR